MNETPDPFSPNPDGRLDTTEFSLLVQADRFPGSPRHRYVLATVFEVYSGTTCELVRRLQTAVEADPTASISYRSVATWDGGDETGAVVADGRYLYRAVTRLARENPGGVVHVLDTASSGFRIVTVDTVPPAVVMEPDPEGLITKETLLPVGGYVKDETKVRVTVAGVDAVLIDSRFSGSAPLVEGANEVVIEAQDAAGNSTVLTRRVTLDTRPPVLGPATLDGQPAAGAVLGTLSPRFRIDWSDAPAGVFPGGVVLRVNGAVQPRDSAITEAGTDLRLVHVRTGPNTLHLEVPDRAGNVARLDLVFTVEAGFVVGVLDRGSPIFGAALVVPRAALPPGAEPTFALEPFGVGVPGLGRGAPAGDGMVLAGPVVKVGPAGTMFQPGNPAELTLPYDPGVLVNPRGAGYVPEELVRVARLVNPEDVAAGAAPVWETLPGPYRLDPANNTVTVLVDHLTPFAATTRDIAPVVQLSRAFLANSGLAADADETIEVVDLDTMRPTGERFRPAEAVPAVDWPGGRVSVKALRMSDDERHLYAVIGWHEFRVVRRPWGLPPLGILKMQDFVLQLDTYGMDLVNVFELGRAPLFGCSTRDVVPPAGATGMLYGLVDCSVMYYEDHEGDGIYAVAVPPTTSPRVLVEQPLISVPVGTSGALVVQEVDGRDIALVATVEGQDRLTLSPSLGISGDPRIALVWSGEEWRNAGCPAGRPERCGGIEPYIWRGVVQRAQPPTDPPEVFLGAHAGMSWSIFPFIPGGGHSGYTALKQYLAPPGCQVDVVPEIGGLERRAFALDDTGKIEHWSALRRRGWSAVAADLLGCTGRHRGFVGSFVASGHIDKLSTGSLFGALVANGHVGIIDLTAGRVVDTVAPQDRAQSPRNLPTGFGIGRRPGWEQRYAFVNDFSADLAVRPSDGTVVLKHVVIGVDEADYAPLDANPDAPAPPSIWKGLFDGYAAAVSALGPLPALAANVRDVTTRFTPRILDGRDTPSPVLLAKSNLTLTPTGEAVALNDRGEVVFVDPATGDVRATVPLPRPGPGPDHYLAASLAQGLRRVGGQWRPVTVVALSDAPEWTAGYHPASGAIY